MNILLTGGSGFLGSALARHLAHRHELTLLLRRESSLARLPDTTGLRIARPETDDDIRSLVQATRPDVVVHTACRYGRQGETLQALSDANIRLGLGLLEALKATGHPATFINTGTVLEASVNPYALSKHQFSQWGEMFARDTAGAIRWLNVRLQHMYGPHDDPSKFTTHVLRSCMRNAPSLQLTLGEQRRDLIYIDDAVTAYDTLIEQAPTLPPMLDIDVGSGVAPTIRVFVETVHRLTGATTELRFGAVPYRANEAMHCQADIAFMRGLGWAPAFDLEAGLKKTLETESP